MATTGRNHLTSSHDRSPFILERRRKLFPIEDHDLDSDLGHISPLGSDSLSDSENEGIDLITDYNITGISQNRKVLGNTTPMSNRSCSETMSPLKLSPCPYTRTFFGVTPKKYSPSHNLKTPHDTSTKPVLQKEQKTLLEESKSLKRKSSPSSSPEQSKTLKVDCKNSKVRTALFPPEDDVYAPLPTKSFYAKNQEDVLEKLSLSRDKYVPKHIKFAVGRHSAKQRIKFGQINNGVGHKIRKPKQKKMSKTVLVKAAKKMLEAGSVLNDYMQDLKELRNKQNTESRLIEKPTSVKGSVTTTKATVEPQIKEAVAGVQTMKKLISTPIKLITISEENKENVRNESQHRSVSPLSLSSPQDKKSRKFFKSSRAKDNWKPNKRQRNKSNEQYGETQFLHSTSLPNGRPQKISNESQESTSESQDITNILNSNDDFEFEDVEPETNIDNILSVLSDDRPQKHILDQNKPLEAVERYEKSKSNSDVFSSLNSISQSSDDKFMFGLQNNNGQTEQYFENSHQVDFLNSSNNIINQNMQAPAYHPNDDCQTIFDATETTPYVFLTTDGQGIDSRQYFPTNSNDNVPNGLGTAANQEYVVTVNSKHDLKITEDNFDETLPSTGNMYHHNTLEPCIVSSQVIFDNLLFEDENETVINALSNQNGLLPNVFTGIKSLETNKTLDNTNKITLEAYNSVLASENSIQLHQNNVANTILSPISHMCDVTSGLALNSPKRGRKLSPFFNNMSRASKILSFSNCNSADMAQQQQKLFPVFYPGAKGAPERGEKREKGEIKRNAKKFKALHEDQMLLDAGQKKFGYTICNECNIVYHMGDPGDELEHMNYHNASHILRFGGWKNEHLMADYQKNGRIIRILPTDSKIWLKKVKDLMEFVKRDLGCYEMEYDISGSQVYLFIKNRTIAGCAVATVPKEAGHRMLSSLSGIAMCSEESYPIKCGISYIWVAANFRKQRIATALMDTVKNNFIYGNILTDNDIALTSPTEAGSAFAERYFKTPNYLVYYT